MKYYYSCTLIRGGITTLDWSHFSPIVIMAFSECLYRRSLFMKISIANGQTINQERRSPYAFFLFLHFERV